MALGPDEGSKNMLESIDKRCDLLEEEIDKAMLTDYAGDATWTYSLPDSLHRKVVHEIARRYEAAGWGKVKYGSDQREGQWLTFYRDKVDGGCEDK